VNPQLESRAMKNKQTEAKLRSSIDFTRHLKGGILYLAVISLICARAPAQNLFATSYLSIDEFTPNGVQSTFASGLNNPLGLTFDKAGNLFVADTGTSTGTGAVYKFTPAGVRTTFASGLNFPRALAFDSQGNLFVTAEDVTIYKFTPSGARTTFATVQSGAYGLAFDRAGNLFVAGGFSFFNKDHAGTVYKFTPTGVRTTFASGLNSPLALAFDSQGNLFVADQGYGYDILRDAAVYKFTPFGVRSTVVSENDQVPVIPSGLAIDGADSLFVSDYWVSGNILKFTPSGMRSIFAAGNYDTALAFQPNAARILNFSTRGFVQTGANVLIGGFIVAGTGPKQVILRALGPTLGQFNVPNALANPVLELYDARSVLITSSDNWGSAPNAAAISASGFAPRNSLESAILTTLSPGNYTAIVRGANNSSGVALVEGYDLDNTALSKFGNVSTRGLVQKGANVMIAGVIVQGRGSENLIIRGLGPTLGQPPFNVPNALQDPFLDLRDANGNMMMTNNNWGSASNAAAISASGYAPPNSHEAAILITLAPGNYTAILSGVNGTSGVALVEVYAE
jgi:sugar lactone lactonase YvrE